MKSIIQEASSISKAIELAWAKANKPEHFSVKVLEDAEKNFFGLTKKSAKIALIFDEQQPVKPRPEATRLRLDDRNRQQERNTSQQRPARQQYGQTSAMPRRSHNEDGRQQQPRVQQAAPEARMAPTADNDNQQRRQFEPLWTPEMVEKAEAWMRDTLNSLEKNITYTVVPMRYHLRITLSEPIFADREKEKQLLAHFATLILETLKRVGKSGLRGHKIVLTHRQ